MPDLAGLVEPLLVVRRVLREEIEILHRRLLAIVRDDDVCRRLMTVPGVGSVVALTYRATVDVPARFRNSKAVGASFGLIPSPADRFLRFLGFTGGIEAVSVRRHDSSEGTIMTIIKVQLSSFELETRYEAAADPVGKRYFHALWLLSSGYEVDEVAEILSFSPRWVRALIKRYDEGGAEALGDQRIHNGTRPTILTPEALAALKERIKTPPDDGGLWTGPKIACWFAKFHGLQSVHDQRGWDALIAIGYSIQQPRPRHPDAATEKDRAALKKNFRPRLSRRGASIRAQPSKSGRWMNTASV